MYIKFRPFPAVSCMDNEFLSTKNRKLDCQHPLVLAPKTNFFFSFSNIVLLLGLINSNSKFRLIQAFHKQFQLLKMIAEKNCKKPNSSYMQHTLSNDIHHWSGPAVGVNTYYFLAKNCHATFLCKFYKLLTFMCYSRWYECYTTADIWAQKYQKAAFSAI